MNRASWVGAWLALVALAPSAAEGQQAAAGGAVAREAPAEEVQEAGFKADLRGWAATHVSATGDDDEADEDPFLLPLSGISLTYSPSRTWGFLFTFLGGTGSGDVRAYDTFGGNTLVYEGDQETLRLDLELLVRYSLRVSPVSLFGGLRYVRFDVEGSEMRLITGTPTGTYDYEDESNGLFFEVGAGFTGGLSEDGRHRLFANLTLMAGAIAWEYSETGSATPTPGDDDGSDGYLGIDTNVGYQWTIGSGFDLSLRYRLFVLGFGPADTELIHGPEVTLGFAF